ncbi:hypothetical protein REPUB_Repub16aG0152000 [Reevesia pubescens]
MPGIFNKICFTIPNVLDNTLHVHLMCDIFWNDDHIPCTSPNSSYNCCVNSDINLGEAVSASRVVVVLTDIKFYRSMYWTTPFQYASNVLTSISFYCHKKDCGSDCSFQMVLLCEIE